MNSEINEIQNNRIVRIKVESLFGLFDYEIPLNDSGVTILIGINGSGKSTIFKILHNVLKAKFYNILDVDFKSFHIYFENGDFIKCERTVQSVDVIDNDLSSNIRGNKQSENYDSYRRVFQKIRAQSKRLVDFSITIKSKVSPLNHKLVSLKTYEDKNEVRYVLNEMTDELTTIYDEIVTKSHFIETQRLQLNHSGIDDLEIENFKKGYATVYRSYRKPDNTFMTGHDIPTNNSRIQEYASDLSNKINVERSNYFAESQNVEKKTLSEYLGKSNIDFKHYNFEGEKDIEDYMSEMDKHISKLSNLGIYNPDETSHISDSKLLYDTLDNLKQYSLTMPEQIETTEDFNKLLDFSLKRSLLKSYAENMEKKLEIFEDLENKIELFTTHVNHLFKYKKMNVDLEKGFVFRLNDGLEKGRIINPIDLSSGEQHEVILNYELIFKTEENSVILIDEPEISLHILWQKKFIDNLLDIAKKNSLNIIVATHSPDIVSNHRNLVSILSEI